MEDRLSYIKRKMKDRKVYYSAFNPSAAYMYEVEDAEDDVLWLIAEVEKLREEKENQH